jgi:hypothetical protein
MTTKDMVLSFVAGLLALRWLSRWLEQGRWYLFGCYWLAAARPPFTSDVEVEIELPWMRA